MQKKWWILIAAIAVAVWGFVIEADKNANRRVNYAVRMCDDAFEKNYDHREDTGNHFDIVLKEGCFDAFVKLPKTWHEWNTQPVGDQNGWWISYWFDGAARPVDPHGPNDAYSFPSHPTSFRLQGHGTVRFYTNKAVDK